MSKFFLLSLLGCLTASWASAAPPSKANIPTTFLVQQHITPGREKNGLVILDEKGLEKNYVEPYATNGARSPDGSWLACTETGDEKTADPNSQLKLALRPLVGKGEPVFLPLKLGQALSGISYLWSSDGNRILIQEERNDRRAGLVRYVRTYEPATKTMKDLKLPDGYYVTDWSIDDKRFLAYSTTGYRICWLKTDGTGDPEYVTPETYACSNAKLSPDGKWLLFMSRPLPTSGEARPSRLYVMNLTTKERIVVDEPGETSGYCWSRGGERVAFTWQKSVAKGTTATDFETFLFTCDKDGRNRTTVTSRKYKADHPSPGAIFFFEVLDWK